MADTEGTTPDATATAADRWGSLQTDRSAVFGRAEDGAYYTIPALFPRQGTTQSSQFHTPYQSVGARGVNNLASKMLLALFPPGGSFFRLKLTPKLQAQIDKQAAKQKAAASAPAPAVPGSPLPAPPPESPDIQGDVEKGLAKYETAVVDRMEQTGQRTQIFQLLKHLIVTGNGMIQVLPDERLRFYSLRDYVVLRDAVGNVLEIVVKQCVSRRTLDPDVQNFLKESAPQGESATDGSKKTDDIDIYTHIYLSNARWLVYQEANGKRIPGTDGSYPKDKSPWIVCRWSAVDGESYGRGLVEEYLGDLVSVELLSKALVEGNLAAAKVILMVDEAGVTSKRAIAQANNLDVIDGKRSDVETLQIDKFADFRVAKETSDGIERRLAAAFLLNTSVQRDAERVTAEEIRYLASELEDALGGVYSVQAQELQHPLVVRLLSQLMRRGDLPRLPSKSVAPQIVTGLDGLGRGHDLQKLTNAVGIAEQQVGQVVLGEYLDVSGYLSRLFTASGVDTDGLVRTEAQVAAARQAQAMQQLAQKAAPNAVKAIGDAASQSQQPPPPGGAAQ